MTTLAGSLLARVPTVSLAASGHVERHPSVVCQAHLAMIAMLAAAFLAAAPALAQDQLAYTGCVVTGFFYYNIPTERQDAPRFKVACDHGWVGDFRMYPTSC